jgi:hypothetical protein
MVRAWGQDPEVPSPALRTSSERLVDEARRIAAIYAVRRDDPLLADVFAALATWGVVVDRWAVTGPSHHAALMRDFPDHPETGTGDVLARFRSNADMLGFYAIGADAVLEAFADFELVRRGRRIEPGGSSWKGLLRDIDAAAAGAADPLRRPARYLALALVEGRHRLVAHRRADHADLTAWDPEGIPETTLIRIQMPWDPPGEAAARRRAAVTDLEQLWTAIAPRLTERELIMLRQVPPDGDDDVVRIGALLDTVIKAAEHLDEPERVRVANAMRQAGPTTSHPVEIVNAALQLTSSIQGDDARDAVA